MNITYLMQYVSRRLHTIVRKFSVQDGSREKVCERADLTKNASFADEEDVYAEKLLTFAEPDCPPLIVTGEAGVSYGIVHSGESVFIVGPVILAPGSESRYKLPPLVAAASLIPFLYHCKAADMISELLLIQNLFLPHIIHMIRRSGRLTVSETVIWNSLREAGRRIISENWGLWRMTRYATVRILALFL